MREINLKQIDLNLLVVLDVLLEERNVTRAAQRMGRTQSATSHALSRLRELFDDPLLVRDGWGMKTTLCAEQLRSNLRRVLGEVQGLFVESETFDPQTATRNFVLAVPDLLGALLPVLFNWKTNTACNGFFN